MGVDDWSYKRKLTLVTEQRGKTVSDFMSRSVTEEGIRGGNALILLVDIAQGER
jgi:hypothetical protein